MSSPEYRVFGSFDPRPEPARTGAIEAPLGQISLTGYTPELLAKINRASTELLNDEAIAASNIAIRSAVEMHGIGLDGRPVELPPRRGN